MVCILICKVSETETERERERERDAPKCLNGEFQGKISFCSSSSSFDVNQTKPKTTNFRFQFRRRRHLPWDTLFMFERWFCSKTYYSIMVRIMSLLDYGFCSNTDFVRNPFFDRILILFQYCFWKFTYVFY